MHCRPLWVFRAALLDGLKQADKLGKIKVVGFDNAEPTLAGIESGTVYGTLLQDQYTMGFNSVMLLRALIERGRPPKDVDQMGFLGCEPLTSAEDVKLYRMRAEKPAGQVN